MLSIVMARLCGLKAAVERSDYGGVHDTDDLQAAIEEYAGESGWRFSLRTLQRQTGLNHEAILNAKRQLYHVGIVKWIRRSDADYLEPNWDFRVVIWDLPDGFCRIEYEGNDGP